MRFECDVTDGERVWVERFNKPDLRTLLRARQWANAILDHAVKDLQAELIQSGREIWFKLFERHQLDPPGGESPSHQTLAQEFALKPVDVNRYLAQCRKLLRERIIDRIRDYVTRENEVAEELLRLFPR